MTDDNNVERWHVFNVFIFACAVICLLLPCISVITSVLIIPEIVCYHFHSLERAPLIVFIHSCSCLLFLFLLGVLVPAYTYHPASNLAHLVVSNCDPGILVYCI